LLDFLSEINGQTEKIWGLKERREGDRSCGCTVEVAYVSMKEDVVEVHVVVVAIVDFV
jgi:hypothetical protein